jgi:GPH family glycoside/pentoside/hexuronide:cation symporter
VTSTRIRSEKSAAPPLPASSPATANGAGPAATSVAPPERLPTSTKILYGAPNVAGAALIIPILINMPKFYADVVLVPLGFLAIAIALARSLDAISDPVVGWLSDRTRTRWGRRRPYIFVGAPLCAIAFCAMMSPPAHLSGAAAGVWFGATFILFFIFHTLFILPYYALGPELTLDYNDRSSLFGIREAFTILGTIIAAGSPGFLMHAFGWNERRVFSGLGIVFAIALTTLFWLLAIRVRERPNFATREPNPLVPGVRRALRNRPFSILLSSYVVGSITGLIPATLLPFYNAYVIQPKNPTLWLSIFLLGYFGMGFLCLPLWLMAARRFGKLPTWLASFVWGVSGGGAMFFLGKGDTGLLMILICWAGASFGAGLFLGPAMQADVIDYDEFHTGRRREAQYGAFWSILPKFIAIPSAAIPIAILASLGYVPNAVQPPAVLLAIRAIFALGPATCGTLSFLIAIRYPISEKIHGLIRAGIERHNRGETATDPLTGQEVPPPNARDVDEDTGWFLDNFSPGELKRYLERGASAPVKDVWRAAAASITVCLCAAILALERLGGASTDPGAVASLSVVVSGFSLAIFAFHIMRLSPARRLASGAISEETVRAHLHESYSGVSVL